ncbi:MAG: UPF0158 family protein [Elusimicrobiota bacterium]
MFKINKITVNIDEICGAMENNSMEIKHYFDLETGEIITVSGFNNEYDDENVSDKIDEEPDRYEAIPTISSGEAYRHMEDFIYTVKDEGLKGELSRAINGKGAFRRFKDVLAENPEEQIMWYDFHDKIIKQKATEWLESIGIKVEKDDREDNWIEQEIKKKKELIEQSINMFVELASKIDGIIEIALFGSLATGKKRIAKDIDLMVFIENTDCIDRLALSHRKVLGKFHASPDVFVFTKNKQFLGNICHRKECPSMSVDCQILGCGDIKYLEKRQGFTFNERNIFKDKPKALWLNPQYEVSISEGWFNQIWGK